MPDHTGVLVPLSVIRVAGAVGSVVTVLAGVWMLSRQDLHHATAMGGTSSPSLNWWGLGIGIGLLAGGVAGLLAAAVNNGLLLITADFLIAVSAMWHPLFWPLFLPSFVLLLDGGVEIANRAGASTCTSAAETPSASGG